MSDSFYLSIIAATGKFFSGKVTAVVFPALDGEREILAHHEDMVIAIDDGLLRFKEEGSDEWRTAVSGRGFVEITHNRVNILLETCERPEDIDRVRAQQAKERAEEKLRQKQSIQEYYHSSAALSRAMARLKATRS
jgi:F-type H+-transporting ATPase subunit epsilon